MKNSSLPSIGKLIGFSFLGLLILVLLLRCLVFVEFGTVEMQTQFGALTGVVYGEGLGFKFPWQSVKSINIKTQSYETSSNPKDSQADFTDFPVDGLTSDGQQVLAMRYTVLFSISPECAITVSRKLGRIDGIVENGVKANVRNLSRIALGQFPAEVLANSIARYENAVIEGFTYVDDSSGEVATVQGLDARLADDCITLEGFLARKPDLDPDYLNAIEQQQIAQENIQTAAFEAQEAIEEKSRIITLAEARQQEAILAAAGRAQATKLQADAEAYAIEVQGIALDKYPSILQWQFVETLGEADYMILPDTGVTPLIPVPPGSSTSVPAGPGN